MRKNKEKFITKSENGDDLELAVLRPNHQVMLEAQKVYNKTFSEAVKSGAFFRQVLQKKMEEQGVWDDAKEKEYIESWQSIRDAENRLKAGKISKWDGRALAIKIKQSRQRIADLMNERLRMDANTVEGQADNARFNFLVSQCTVYNETGEKFFKDYEDYVNRSAEQASIDAAGTLAAILHDYDKSAEDNLLENKFLKKFKFVDDDLNLVNEEGHLVNEEGKLVDEEGFLVDQEGNRLTQKEEVDFDKVEFYD